MKRFLSSILLFAGISLSAQNLERYLLEGWTFHRGSCDSPGLAVSIPHDWAISGPFDKEIDKQMVAIEQNGELAATEKTGRSGALPWIGEGWYKTEINIPCGYPHVELHLGQQCHSGIGFCSGESGGQGRKSLSFGR